jgi:hypothetical protein
METINFFLNEVLAFLLGGILGYSLWYLIYRLFSLIKIYNIKLKEERKRKLEVIRNLEILLLLCKQQLEHKIKFNDYGIRYYKENYPQYICKLILSNIADCYKEEYLRIIDINRPSDKIYKLLNYTPTTQTIYFSSGDWDIRIKWSQLLIDNPKLIKF